MGVKWLQSGDESVPSGYWSERLASELSELREHPGEVGIVYSPGPDYPAYAGLVAKRLNDEASWAGYKFFARRNEVYGSWEEK